MLYSTCEMPSKEEVAHALSEAFQEGDETQNSHCFVHVLLFVSVSAAGEAFSSEARHLWRLLKEASDKRHMSEALGEMVLHWMQRRGWRPRPTHSISVVACLASDTHDLVKRFPQDRQEGTICCFPPPV